MNSVMQTAENEAQGLFQALIDALGNSTLLIFIGTVGP